MAQITAFRRIKVTAPESMGVVKDMLYAHCFWPEIDQPTKLFAEGSSGIQVMGSPTPRNVVFPPDTIFVPEHLDARYPAEMAVRTAFPQLFGLVNLTDEQAAVWKAAYDKAVSELPPTSTITITKPCFMLRHKERISPDGARKPLFERYVAELTSEEADALLKGQTTREALFDQKTFVSLHDETKVLVKPSKEVRG